MNRTRKLELFAVLIVGIACLAVVLSSMLSQPQRVMVVTGAVLRDDGDPHRQLPLGDVKITVADPAVATTKSEASGLFRLNLGEGVVLDRKLTLSFSHPEYQPRDVSITAGNQLQVVRMLPNVREPNGQRDGVRSKIADVRMRYATKAQTTVNVGSAVRPFEIKNQANVPCDKTSPCSPDRKWKATVDSVSLDAGERREFRNVRVSCIAGPCPFSKIESDEFTRGGRKISASVLNWSDTVTYLLEAEVTHTMVSDRVHYAYPAIFGESMNFTLPVAAQGMSIEAQMNGSEIVFPLGPNLRLSWADCTLTATDQAKLYRCDVKPGYRF